jgi:hypothetical protein
MRALPRTLRGKLIAGLLALLTAACATVGLVTYLAVQRSLSSELTNNLQTATGLAYQCYNPGGQGPHNDGPGGQPPTGDDQGDMSPDGDHQGTSGGQTDGSGHGKSPGEEASSTPDNSLSARTSAPASANPWPTLDSSAPGAPNSLPSTLPKCQGLDEGTFVAVLWHGNGRSAIIIGGNTTTLSPLSAADLKTLLGITPWKPSDPAKASNGENIPTTTRYLSEAGGTFLLTALSDPDGDGSVYITGVPLSGLHDMLGDVALVEAAVF